MAEETNEPLEPRVVGWENPETVLDDLLKYGPALVIHTCEFILLYAAIELAASLSESRTLEVAGICLAGASLFRLAKTPIFDQIGKLSWVSLTINTLIVGGYAAISGHAAHLAARAAVIQLDSSHALPIVKRAALRREFEIQLGAVGCFGDPNVPEMGIPKYCGALETEMNSELAALPHAPDETEIDGVLPQSTILVSHQPMAAEPHNK